MTYFGNVIAGYFCGIVIYRQPNQFISNHRKQKEIRNHHRLVMISDFSNLCSHNNFKPAKKSFFCLSNPALSPYADASAFP